MYKAKALSLLMSDWVLYIILRGGKKKEERKR